MPSSKKKTNFDQLIGVIKDLDSTQTQQILAGLARQDPSLAQALLEAMFTFDDLIHLTDRSMQFLIKEIDRRTLIRALKKTSAELQQKFLRNLSKRARETLLEEIEIAPPLRLSEVKEAQRQIANYARTLEEEGRIVVVRPDDDDPLV